MISGWSISPSNHFKSLTNVSEMLVKMWVELRHVDLFHHVSFFPFLFALKFALSSFFIFNLREFIVPSFLLFFSLSCRCGFFSWLFLLLFVSMQINKTTHSQPDVTPTWPRNENVSASRLGEAKRDTGVFKHIVHVENDFVVYVEYIFHMLIHWSIMVVKTECSCFFSLRHNGSWEGRKELLVGFEPRPVRVHVVPEVDVSATKPSVGHSYSYFVLYLIFLSFLSPSLPSSLLLIIPPNPCFPPSVALRMNEQ